MRNHDIPFLSDLKTKHYKYDSNYFSSFGGCGGPERHQILTILNGYYGYFKEMFLVIFHMHLLQSCDGLSSSYTSMGCKVQSSTFSIKNQCH